VGLHLLLVCDENALPSVAVCQRAHRDQRGVVVLFEFNPCIDEHAGLEQALLIGDGDFNAGLARRFLQQGCYARHFPGEGAAGISGRRDRHILVRRDLRIVALGHEDHGLQGVDIQHGNDRIVGLEQRSLVHKPLADHSLAPAFP
jgi:hypothetical protein